MIPAEPTQVLCPKCSGTFSYAQENGTRFCPECRNEWDPRAPTATPTPVAVASGTPDIPAGLTTAAGLAEAWSTILEVTYWDPTPGIERRDRYTHVTATPHEVDDAVTAATRHFSDFQGVEVRGTVVVLRDPGEVAIDQHEDFFGAQDQAERQAGEAAIAATEADADLIAEVEDFITETNGTAEAYLESLVGSGVTLEGGQTATLLGFPDDDHAEVQLADGSVATVDFNSIIGANRVVEEADIGLIEVDDDTAALFGSAALLMACMVIEAGVASVEGVGEESHLIEPPSGWIPDDGEVLPLLEQSAAAAVALLIQTFALPRDLIAESVAKVRAGINPILNPEEPSHADQD